MLSLRAESLGKAYRHYRRPLDSLKEMLLRRPLAEPQWALRNVSFELLAGDSLGIIGDNGAGKSTLLKLLSNAALPTEGRLVRHGRVAALLQLGGGFHPDLSGLENMRIGCAVQGLSPNETAQVLPEIIAFSELGAWIDHPLRTYSSGMSLRLGFSVATAIQPDILVVDEHLAVGDQHFQHKCMRRILALREAGCTLVFCSHEPYTVSQVCQRTLWLHKGEAVMLGNSAAVLAAYQDHVREQDAGSAAEPALPQVLTRDASEAGESALVSIELTGEAQGGVIQTGGCLVLDIQARISESAWREGVHVGLLVERNDGLPCCSFSTKTAGLPSSLEMQDNGLFRTRLVIDPLPLLSGRYSFKVALLDERSPLVYHHVSGVAPFDVESTEWAMGLVQMDHRWDGGGT